MKLKYLFYNAMIKYFPLNHDNFVMSLTRIVKLC